jgi:CBS domain-containing protein
MYCPTCDHLNVPGAEACEKCQADMMALDRPMPHDKVEASLMLEPVSALGPKPPMTVAESQPIGDAIRLMIDKSVGAVLVTDGHKKLVGILTERDFLTKIAGQTGYETLPVKEFMTAAPETVSPTDPLALAMQKMDIGGYRHLPVVGENNRPCGVISVRDVLKHVTRLCKETDE